MPSRTKCVAAFLLCFLLLAGNGLAQEHAGVREVEAVVPEADPANIPLETALYLESEGASDSVPFGNAADNSRQVEGVLTFRGSSQRQNAAYGTIPENPSLLSAIWSIAVGGDETWSGIGWTGQPAIVKWDDATKDIMNLEPTKKEKEALKEVIYAALDGNIRFLDLDDGIPTRDAISVGAPIKGSVTVDPRGYPLLYCGQGIQVVNGVKKPIGFRAFSLIDQAQLLFIDGVDDLAPRGWYAFDGTCLVDAGTDTLLEVGENGVFYRVALNTAYDEANGTISLDPSIDRYIWKSSALPHLGVESSVAIYNRYAYFSDNAGLLQCVDLNTMQCMWAVLTGDDTDATCAIEETELGVSLYTGNRLDQRGNRGTCNLRKFDALTGALIWQRDISVSNNTYGGLFASPVIGENALSDLVFFNVSCTSENGTLLALDKATGGVRWSLGLGQYSHSTPVALYTKSGKGYLVVCDSMGIVRLVDGANGAVLSTLDLGRNIEGSPAAYDDMLVVGTRGGRIYGVKVS